MRIGNICGIVVAVNGWFLLLLAIFSFLGLFEKVCLAFFCVFVHELAHVGMARYFRVAVQKIELLPFGGVAQMDGFVETTRGNQVMIALAGPGSSFLLAAIGWGIKQGQPAMDDFVAINCMLGLVNLLPAIPLDGGKILQAALATFFHGSQAAKYTVTASFITGMGLLAKGTVEYVVNQTVNISLGIIAVFILAAAAKEMRHLRYHSLRYILQKKVMLKEAGHLPLCTHVALEDYPAVQLIKNFSSPAYHIVFVLDCRQRVRGLLTEAQLLEALESGEGKITLRDILNH